MARLADIQAARLAGALLTGDAVKGDAPFTLISRRKVRFWIGASATLAAIILVSLLDYLWGHYPPSRRKI